MTRKKKSSPHCRRMLTIERDDQLDSDLDRVRKITSLSRRVSVKKALGVYRRILESELTLINEKTGAEVEIG